MVDGGKGQLSTARPCSTSCSTRRSSPPSSRKPEAIKLCSLAKQEELVYHYGDDGNVCELRLPRTDPGLRLLVALRDEAHRFGDAQHARLREKAMRPACWTLSPGWGRRAEPRCSATSAA